jgi:hypothetical protein
MFIYIIRLGLIAIIALLGIKCLTVGTFGPMLTGFFLLSIAGAWIIIELILAGEQIVNGTSHYAGGPLPENSIVIDSLSEEEALLIYITEHPNKFSEDSVRHAHLQLDEMYFNRIHQKD